MTKAEFEEKAHCTVTDKDYELIEFVYTWHPCIHDDGSAKSQVAYLFNNFGIRIFHDMRQTAIIAKYLEDDISEQKRVLRDLEIQRDRLLTCREE